MRLKHNKKRNTAFLYECLIQELAKCVVESNHERRDEILSIVRKHFAKGSELKKELFLYTTLSETRSVSARIATRLIEEVRKNHEELNSEEVFKAQTSLVKDINSVLGTGVFSNFVQNYRNLASVQQIFNNGLKPKERVLLEAKVVSLMTHSGDRESEPNRVESHDNIVLRTFIQKFNDKYENLHEEQKGLLTRYVLSFQNNGVELKTFLNEEISRLKTELKKTMKVKEVAEDPLMLEKTQKVSDSLDKLHGQKVDRDILKRILQIQHLVREANTDG